MLTDIEIESKYGKDSDGCDTAQTGIEKYKKIQYLIGTNTFSNTQENITICLGNTKSGKSSIVQALLGTELISIENAEGQTIVTV